VLATEINQLLQIAEKEIAACDSEYALDQCRSRLLGKKGVIASAMQQLTQIPVNERREIGQAINMAKDKIMAMFEAQRVLQVESAIVEQLARDAIDVTLPGCGQRQGHRHPVSLVREQVIAIFSQMGFMAVDGPEIEDEFHNFTALNIPEHHPARAMHDTFYLENGHVLRTHTSPVQIRYMREHEPPIRLVAAGRVYRCDSDLTHTPMFHQLEGLVVDRTISFSHLKCLLQDFLSSFFNGEVNLRFRPSYFPFTEPSAEVDMQCVHCLGGGCRICKQTGWLEILGCGMVHPNVFNHVGIDPEQFTGFAFGIGLDRLAMLRFGITDLRSLFEGDLRFLGQF
jgi:phenylalanyl-tRNA synthetase alpha chain